MAGRSSKWLLGCGIGCGVVILIVVVFGVSGFLLIKDTMKPFDEAISIRKDLTERFGEAATFTPDPRGGFTSDRIELFLAVRDSLVATRQRIAHSFLSFESVDDEIEAETTWYGKLGRGLKVGKTGLGLGGQIGEFYLVRNRVLLDLGMGLGEYIFLYVLAYYSYLGHSPEDGPENVYVDTEGEGARVQVGRSRRNRENYGASFRRVRQDVISMLRNQLDALPGGAESSTWDSWQQDLAAEIAALEANSRRMIWQDGLPDSYQESFAPYHTRLEALYSAATNPFELARNRRSGWSYRSD